MDEAKILLAEDLSLIKSLPVIRIVDSEWHRVFIFYFSKRSFDHVKCCKFNIAEM